MTLWFEDIPIDQIFILGEHTFTRQEIIEFGEQYDPQYFHVDEALAKHSQFGNLIASGWHTVCVGHRIMVDSLFAQEDRLRAQGKEPGVSGPSPGVNSMEFKAPVRVGDTVGYQLTVTSKRLSNSIPGWGILHNLLEATNQNGQLVYRAQLVGFSKLRDFKPSLKQRFMLTASKFPALRKLLRK